MRIQNSELLFTVNKNVGRRLTGSILQIVRDYLLYQIEWNTRQKNETNENFIRACFYSLKDMKVPPRICGF